MFSIRSVPTACTARPSRRKSDIGSASLNKLILTMVRMPSRVLTCCLTAQQTTVGVLVCRASSKGRREGYVHVELHRDLAQPAVNAHDFAQSRIEIILEHHWSRILQEKVGGVRDSRARQDAQFVARRNVLNDTGNAGDSQVAQRVSPMAPVVEDEPVLRVNGVQEVAAKSHSKPNYTGEVAGGRIVLNIFRLHRHGAEKAHVVGWGHEDERVSVSAS